MATLNSGTDSGGAGKVSVPASPGMPAGFGNAALQGGGCGCDSQCEGGDATCECCSGDNSEAADVYPGWNGEWPIMSVATSTSVSVEPDVGGDERLGAIKKLFEKKQPPPGPGGGTDGGGDDWDPFPTDPWDIAGMLAWFERHPEDVGNGAGGSASQWVTADEATPNTTEVKPPEKICGPDVTDSVIQLMNEVGSQIAGVSGLLGMSISTFGKLFGEEGGPLDFKSQTPTKIGGGSTSPGEACPTECPDTVTICGHCTDSSTVGNLVFGAAAAAHGLDKDTALAASDYGENGGWAGIRNYFTGEATEAAWDQYSVGSGWSAYDSKGSDGISRSDFCEKIAGGRLQPPSNGPCKPCSSAKAGYAIPRLKVETEIVSYPGDLGEDRVETYYRFEIEPEVESNDK